MRAALLAMAAGIVLAAGPAGAGELTISVEGAKGDATVFGQLFADAASFAKRSGGYAVFKIDPVDGRGAARILRVPPGHYAVAVFQDVAGTGRLETNFLGVPTEPYGFSRDAEGTMGPPGFDQAVLAIGDAPQSILIHLH